MEVRQRGTKGGVETSARYRGDSAPASLGLLGGFEFRLNTQTVALPTTAKRLLVFLALRERALDRTYVSQVLWPDTTERHANGNLRSALWKVRSLTGQVVEVAGTDLALRIDVDYHAASALARKVVRESRSLTDGELDEKRFLDDLLPDSYDEWVVKERELYRQLRLHALETLCGELVARRRFGPAIQAGLAAVAGEPLRESGNLALIHAYLHEGNACEAIRHYHGFRTLLWKELKVLPSRAMTRLIETQTGALTTG